MIHYTMNDAGGFGHMMLVRALGDNGVYLIDQHSLFTKLQTDKDYSIGVGESTFSTYHFYSYERR